jgi:hypothetical protein
MDHPARAFHGNGMGMEEPRDGLVRFVRPVINQAWTVDPGYLRVSRTDRERAI